MLYLIEIFNPNSRLIDEISISSHAYKSAINIKKKLRWNNPKNGAEITPKTALK